MTDRSEIVQGHFEVFDADKPTHAMASVVNMLVRASSNETYNLIAIAHREAIQCLSRLYVPRLSVTPSPEEFEDLADFATRWAKIGDQVIKAIGEEVRSNSSESINESMFRDRFFGALDGDTTFEIDRCAEAVRAEQDEWNGIDPDYEYEDRRSAE